MTKITRLITSDAALAIAAFLVAALLWAHYYVIPRDRAMHAVMDCLTAHGWDLTEANYNACATIVRRGAR
jgi:hypothetical protein